MALAILSIEVKADGAAEAEKKLDGMSAAAGRAEKSADKLTKSAGMLSGALGAIATVATVAAIGRMADSWSDLNSRVGLAIGSHEKAGAVMQQLGRMANATYSDITTTTDAFIENASVLGALGKSTKDQIRYTESLNNALVASGAKAEKAASVQTSLSNALALGALSGNDFNNVIKNGGEIVGLLAKELGVSTLELRKLASEGKITRDVLIDSVLNGFDEMAEKAESMPATIGDAFQRMANNGLIFVGTLDQMSGASGIVAEALLTVADNVDRLIVYGSSAAIAYGTYFVGAMAASAVATAGLTGALKLLRAALISTGIGAVVVLVGELAYQMLKAREATGSWGEAFQEVSRRVELAMEGVQWAFYAAIDGMKSAWSKFLSHMVSSTEQAMSKVYATFGASFGGFGTLANDLLDDSADHAANAADQLSLAAEKFKEALAPFELPEVDLGGGGGGGGGFGGGSLGDAAKGGGRGKDEKSRAAERLARDMEQRLEVLKEGLMSEEELLLAQYEKDLETLQWHLDNKKITEQEYLDWKAQVTRDHEAEMQALRTQSFSDALGATSELMGAMASVIGSGNDKILKAQKIFGAAQALVNTYIAASQTLADPRLGFFAKFAAVAAVIAKGMSLVAAVKSGAKSGASGGGSIGNTQSAAPEKSPDKRQAAEIKLHGEVFNRDMVAELIGKINDMSKDGYVIDVVAT